MHNRFIRAALCFLAAMCFSPMTFAQSAGTFVATVGPAWVDFGRSGATELVSQSSYGTYTSSGTGGEVRNVLTPEAMLSYFITNNIAVEGTIGVPPKLNVRFNHSDELAAGVWQSRNGSNSLLCGAATRPECLLWW